MRIPWYICVSVALLAFGITYWMGARGYDFVTPPNLPQGATEMPIAQSPLTDNTSSEPSLEEPEQRAGSVAEPAADQTPEPEEVEQVVESHPSDYLDHPDKSTAAYVALAEKLIQEKKEQHSLVAWERVLDSSQPSPEVVKQAFEILKLHKPVLKSESAGIAISLTLHASVPADLYERAEKMLRRAAQIIEIGAAYSISVIPEISVVTVAKGKPRPAFSVWLSGKHETPRGSFHTTSATQLGLDEKVNIAIFNIVSSYLEENSTLTPLVKPHNEINAEEALAYLITRHSWRQIGLLLYQNVPTEEDKEQEE